MSKKGEKDGPIDIAITKFETLGYGNFRFDKPRIKLATEQPLNFARDELAGAETLEKRISILYRTELKAKEDVRFQGAVDAIKRLLQANRSYGFTEGQIEKVSEAANKKYEAEQRVQKAAAKEARKAAEAALKAEQEAIAKREEEVRQKKQAAIDETMEKPSYNEYDRTLFTKDREEFFAEFSYKSPDEQREILYSAAIASKENSSFNGIYDDIRKKMRSNGFSDAQLNQISNDGEKRGVELLGEEAKPVVAHLEGLIGALAQEYPNGKIPDAQIKKLFGNVVDTLNANIEDKLLQDHITKATSIINTSIKDVTLGDKLYSQVAKFCRVIGFSDTANKMEAKMEQGSKQKIQAAEVAITKALDIRKLLQNSPVTDERKAAIHSQLDKQKGGGRGI